MDKKGQSIIVIAVVLAALFVFTAIATDGARAYTIRRQMQTAADAGALAGAYQLCVGGTDRVQRATAQARHFAMLNDATEPITVLVNLDLRTVGVDVLDTSPTFFAGIIGFREFLIGAHAKARATCDGGEYVIWAHSDECNNNIDWSSNDIDVDGDVHSNRDFKMGGQNNDLRGRTEYVTHFQVNPRGNVVDPYNVSYDPNWPIWYDLATFQVLSGPYYHYHDGNFDVNESGTVLHGLHYVNGDVHFVGNDLSGSVTIVATGVIQISGTGHNFTPFYENLFLFSAEGWPQGNKNCADAVIDVSGSDCSYGGVFFAPGGKIRYSGSGYSVLDGAIVANSIRIDGSGGTITGGVGQPREVRVRLIE
jgi:hypothetical protein